MMICLANVEASPAICGGGFKFAGRLPHGMGRSLHIVWGDRKHMHATVSQHHVFITLNKSRQSTWRIQAV
jgi:hypothetical protein